MFFFYRVSIGFPWAQLGGGRHAECGHRAPPVPARVGLRHVAAVETGRRLATGRALVERPQRPRHRFGPLPLLRVAHQLPLERGTTLHSSANVLRSGLSSVLLSCCFFSPVFFSWLWDSQVSSVKLLTKEIGSTEIPFKVNVQWPQLAVKRRIQFPLTEIGHTSQARPTLEFPIFLRFTEFLWTLDLGFIEIFSYSIFNLFITLESFDIFQFQPSYNYVKHSKTQ